MKRLAPLALVAVSLIAGSLLPVTLAKQTVINPQYVPSIVYPTLGSGTGVSTTYQGISNTTLQKITVASTQFICASTNCDFSIVSSVPAKQYIKDVIVDLTTTFACASTCTTSTLSMTVGNAAGGAQYNLSFDADAATGQFGATNATLGTSIDTRQAGASPLGLVSWSSTGIITIRLTSGTGNIGTGAATNLSQGSVTFYIFSIPLP